MHYKFIASSATVKSKIPKFAELIRGIHKRNKKMLSFKAKIPKKRGGSLQPILPLIPSTVPISEDDKGSYLSFELKTRIGQPDAQSKYKKYVRKFDDGEPQQWIDLKNDITEIWTQNSVNGGTDRSSTVRALLKGESLTAFESALQDARTDEDGTVAAITADHVKTAMEAVAQTVFPHRALETQKLWMNRSMFKPRSLSTRATSAAISRLNNALPHFPGGSDTDKFSEITLVGMLEWSLPPLWREQFDLKGYIPTQHDRKRLISECEAIERHITDDVEDKETHAKKKKKKNAKDKANDPDRDNKKFYCTEHGHNSTHSTGDCFTIKNREKKANKTKNGEKNTFSNKAFRKEINLLARKSSKKKVLDLYATAIKKERAKMAAKKVRKNSEANDESDSDDSIHVIEMTDKANSKKRNKDESDDEYIPKTKIKKGKAAAVLDRANKKARKNESEESTLEEEKEYKRKVQWLKDHGESDSEENEKDSNDSDESG